MDKQKLKKIVQEHDLEEADEILTEENELEQLTAKSLRAQKQGRKDDSNDK